MVTGVMSGLWAGERHGRASGMGGRSGHLLLSHAAPSASPFSPLSPTAPFMSLADGRHWDTWRVPGKVWTIGLTHLDVKSITATTAKPSFINLLNSTRLTSQSDPHGSIAVSKDHIAFTVKPPHLNFARHTREDVYVLPLPQATHRYDHVQPSQITPQEHGAISSVKFSPDGKKLAWLQMAEDGYESDKRVVVVYHIGKNGLAGKTERWTDEWDRSPSSLEVG